MTTLPVTGYRSKFFRNNVGVARWHSVRFFKKRFRHGCLTFVLYKLVDGTWICQSPIENDIVTFGSGKNVKALIKEICCR